jgi:pimeloyl-ACP methyl ester carboxylesterase
MSTPRTFICLIFAFSTGLLFAGGGCMSASAEPTEKLDRVEHRETVVLLHGMGRTGFSMSSMATALEERGYNVINWSYSSLCCSIAELGEQLADDLDALDGPRPERLHFVGHSLGGIIIRWLLHNRPPPEQGRVVMLASPNQGSQLADQYVDWAGWLLEPIDELTTDDASTARNLAPIQGRQVGTIAGELDGKVTPTEARMATETDHAVVPAYHSFIMNRSDVQHMVGTFLQDGRFEELPRE